MARSMARTSSRCDRRAVWWSVINRPVISSPDPRRLNSSSSAVARGRGGFAGMLLGSVGHRCRQRSRHTGDRCPLPVSAEFSSDDQER